MELAPCSDEGRQVLVDMLNSIQADGISYKEIKRKVGYVVKTFPNILLDVARILTEQATANARTSSDSAIANRQQLKPFFVFGFLIGKSPQITSLMYSYFENSSFQPLPEESFQLDNNTLIYTYLGYDDNIVKEILITYLKYLSFNPKWFSAVWNWSELGRFISFHPNCDIRYLASCCLSIITQPTRHQHMSLMHDIIVDPQTLIEVQIKHSYIFKNTFRPLVETRAERAGEFILAWGPSQTGYKFCSESLTKITNILLLKRDVSHESNHMKSKIEKAINKFVPVVSICDTISKIAYAASIGKPCLIRGPTGSGKTSILDFIAAHTNRIAPPAYVKVQVGDQIDSKSLVGNYVCTEIPGQFEWQPGPLTQAMTYGSWIVFEDIDSAPSELAQVIHSVIENGNLSCVSCCPIKIDSPHPDFRIFFTQRAKGPRIGFGFIERLCDIVDLPEIPYSDLKEILEKRYQFGPLKETILQLYTTAKMSLTEVNASTTTRIITLRDLFKFCDRISSRSMQAKDGKYSSSDLDALLADAIECFIACLPEQHLKKVAEELGQVLNKSPNETDAMLARFPDLHDEGDSFKIGRAQLDPYKSSSDKMIESRSTLAKSRQTLQLLEQVSMAVKNREPVLLVGETGVGKTTIVQHLANMMRTELMVINLSQQSDSSDLLGGYRPVDMRDIVKPINERFVELFEVTFDAKENRAFLETAESLYIKSRKCSEWLIYLKMICNICSRGLEKCLSRDKLEKWGDLLSKSRKLTTRLSEDNSSPMALSFSEGTLLKAVRKGQWILLDEINLAEPDVLQCLLLILDSLKDSYVYMHSGCSSRDGPTFVHPNFRIFSCMNPSTDIGKRDLPIGIRGRFTEFYMNDVDEPYDLRLIVDSYVKACLKPAQVERIVKFYREIRFRSSTLSDVSGNSPVYSLRTLCRALVICSQNVCRNIEKSILESFKIAFLQQLNEFSVAQVLKLIEQTILCNTSLEQLSEIAIPMPMDNHQYVEVEGFWIQTSSRKICEDENYILTKSVKRNLERLSRILCLGQRKLPILVQGDTSVGKTSLIKYLAKISGNHCYRINNHEHTDLQEYVGRYVLKENGELHFQEGLLVTAMRKGYWVILDELNLAPCELLEALNRVLDDNRELFIPETRETVRAHSKFVLFATQNPPQEYAGRKLLSRAFRNRFIELHFDAIPHNELEEILQNRCKMAPQYAKKIVSVMKELQIFRRESGCFNGKNGFMTIRDLFRWGERYLCFKDTVDDREFVDWERYLASEGLIILEGRVRTTTEADTVKSIIEKVFKLKLDRNSVYQYEIPPALSITPAFKHIHFTQEFKKLYVQLERALNYKEPVLLCGQTGCGKTTACQLYAHMMEQELIIYNCHLNTESSDFIGNVRPGRSNDQKSHQLFPWHDGPLVQAMKRGAVFLMDEISLADDAVLERINSVLEPDRSITITELNGDEVVANERFRFVATMNPGGDYGKKELSPALRNRFTEIYCHNTMDIAQIVSIIEKSLLPALLKPKIAPSLIKVMRQFLSIYYKGQDVISLRDVLSWTKFLNKTTNISQVAPLSIQDALINGANLVFFDQFGTCGHNSIHIDASTQLRDNLIEKLRIIVLNKIGKEPKYDDKLQTGMQNATDFVRFGKFCLRKGPRTIERAEKFVLDAPTVKANAEKLVRALQLDRPVLLEGDPGAGKTSIVSALAQLTGHKLVRINLSEQTDVSDLFGADLPDSTNLNDDVPRFCWHDGPMLKAIKESGWVLLDEMNLASQSVLEGLNALFDHRGEVYIPELDKKFNIDRNTTRIFACQNPYSQGAARKGLPQSFLNRFTSIYVESHKDEDLSTILRKLYPNLPHDLIEKMILFNKQVSYMFQFQGYEFNLRDLIYWCDLMTKYVDKDDFKLLDLYEPDRFVQFVYIDRMRSLSDKNELCDLFEKLFGYPVYEPPYRDIKLGEYSFLMTRSILLRKKRLPPHLSDSCILKYQMPYIESLAKAIEFNKMPILVGESGVGKRTMVKILAGLTGNEVNIVGANRDMDTVELLGSFEQKSLQREIVDLVEETASFTKSLINSVSRRLRTDSWTQLYKHIWSTLFATSIRDLKLSKSDLMDAYRFQLSQMEELITKLRPLSINEIESKCKNLQRRIVDLRKKVLFHSESTYSSGNFEWIDSVLIKSIKNGSWLMIENANLLNPATLDRLNSLIEPNGTLSLNEKGSGPEGIEIIEPHPDFRLILTMNPEYGELSRAMRNRGIEIYVRTRFYYEDFLILLNQNGFVPEESKACMTYCIMQTSYDSHEKITDEKPENDGSLLAYFGLNYLGILAHQIRRGLNVDTVLGDMLVSFYHRKGHLENSTDPEISSFVVQKMNEYRAKYVVDLNDDRYKWNHFRHDLVSLTGGDAIPAMLIREGKLLLEFSCPIATGLLKLDEMIECFDIVVTCTSVKIFLELSTHGDFDYRKMFIKDTFSPYPKILDIINTEVESLERECLALITNQMPTSELLPVTEMYVDTRNSQDLHYHLLSMDYQGTLGREDLQNRWLLSLHRIALAMITDLVEENSLEAPGNTSLFALSDKVRSSEMLKEDLIRPQVEIAADLYDLLNGLLRVVSNRCFSNNLVAKMMARLFWIGHILCKLKKALNKMELIALCNQIPMLWALTYQKVVIPIMEDCNLADLSYNNKKFSTRIEHICDFLDVTITKPSKLEKEYYNKVLNLHAATTKRCESVSREIDKFFNTLLGRYTVKSQAFSIGSENASTLVASNLVWSNSVYVAPLYHAVDILSSIESTPDDNPEGMEQINLMLSNVRNLLVIKRNDYESHEESIKTNDHYRSKCLVIHRRRCALDQFAPVWQSKFIQARFSKLNPDIDSNKASYYQSSLRRLLFNVNGLVLSPRYLGTLTKFLQVLARRPKRKIEIDASVDEVGYHEMSKIPRQNLDMYAAYLVDFLLENIVLDNQVVGWIKMRVNTSDLSASAPLIPEHSPIISLVSSYCLDISHLKLNSYQSSSPQLDSMLMYLWRSYAQIKFNPKNVDQNLSLARNLLHLRLKLGSQSELVGEYECPNNSSCSCIDEYIHRRAPKFRETVNAIREKSDPEDSTTFEKAVKLIYYGFYNLLEYAPIFTLDPSLRFREKMEVYIAELAHTKADLHQRNTLHYWKTGENLRLVDITTDEAKLYPMSIRVLVERREKLEKSLGKLRREFTNRPKSDDGSLYYELRKEVEISITRNTNNINSLVADLLFYLSTKKPLQRSRRVTTLTTKCRMLIKTFERTIARFKSDFVLYSDLTTNYLTGSCFVLQGMRLLYSRLEQKMQLINMGFTHGLVNRFSYDIMRLFSFNNFTLNNLESVSNKRALYSILPAICPDDKVSYIQSLLLRSALIQLNHHISMTPSDIKQCIPIVRNIADKFHKAWLERKTYLEEQRKKQEDLYQYKTSHTSMGNQISFERQEFIAICNKFPLYDHIYQDHINVPSTSTERDNLETEAKIINMNRSVDLTMCIDVCKAHYKFMKEASLNLLGLQNLPISQTEVRNIDINQLIKLEAEILYTIMRKCVPNFGARFDSLSIECHLLQANHLIKVLRQRQLEQLPVGSLVGSIEILDEDIFDIYYSACPHEVLKFQELLTRIDDRITSLRNMTATSYSTHPLLHHITRLTERISSFLITDPLMKFVTGAHTLLQQLEEWNKVSIRDCRMTEEADILIETIHSWRAIEIKSWRSSLHRVKRKYIDDSLCDLWFRLYEAFNDPIGSTTKLLIEKEMVDEDFELSADDENFYQAFVLLIKNFFEDATLGDYQIRLDLVFSFAIQTRFASLYEKTKSPSTRSSDQSKEIDHEKLTTYVYNIYRQYQGWMGSLGKTLEREEAVLSTELNNEIRIVNWQGRNLWEIKNNFRISHRKLNKVMNKYLEVLRRPVPVLDGAASARTSDEPTAISHNSTKLSSIFDQSFNMIIHVPDQNRDSTRLLSLKLAPKISFTMKKLMKQVHSSAKSRYVDVVKSIEDTLDVNSDLIKTFHTQRVEDLSINPKDSKDTRAEKMKTCRQIYHSKKFALQSIFKNLRELGISYQRGLNSSVHLDKSILSLEPLRGMIQNQSKSVLKAASELVDDSLIIACNVMYRDMLTKNQVLLTQLRADDLTGGQMERIQGCAYDVVLDIILHNRNAALIYRHLIDIHAATTRLQQLRNNSRGEKILVYKFARIHSSVRKFNELVSRAFSSITKLELLMDCFKTYSELQTFENEIKSPNSSSETTKEREILKELIVETNERYSLMTHEQYSHLQENILDVHKGITEVSSELRDKLRHTIKNHLYSDDDIEHIQQLYDKFVTILRRILPEGSHQRINTRPGTILGSMISLCTEAENKLKPVIQTEYFTGKDDQLDLDNHPNINKLDIRLQKLLKQVRLAAQEILKDELEFINIKPTNESARRKMKPFNHIDSSRIRDLLRPSQVSKQVANCFMTLNIENRCTNVQPIITQLSPILFIYSQEVGRYLNVILTSMHLKLLTASQLIPFFIDIVMNGFGLPYKIEELENGGEQRSNGAAGDDNVGFGEGQGENDASNKIEFESQLDDLKKGDDNEKDESQDTDTGPSTDNIEAHDDGVEMSEDFDAKLEGAGDQEPNREEGDDESVAEDEDVFNELDKEFDNVEQDEGNLDQNLWDDKDEPLGEDDEEDLREADLDLSTKPEMDEKDLMAKNDGLKQSSTTDKSDALSDGDEEPEMESSELQLDADANDNEAEEEFNDTSEDKGDFNETGENLEESNDQQEQKDEDESSLNVVDTSIEMSDISQDDADATNKTEDTDEKMIIDSDIDVDIDVDDTGDNIERGGQDSSGAKGKAQGSREDDQEEEVSQNDLDEASDPAGKNVSTALSSKPTGDQSNPADGDDEDQQQQEVEDLAGKRTFADRNSIDRSTLKRQKIENAAPSVNKEMSGDTNQQNQATESVRHLEVDRDDAIEIIDLASDSDDDYLLDNGSLPDKIDQKQSTRPRDFDPIQDGAGDKAAQQDDDDPSNVNDSTARQQSTYNTNLGLLKFISHGLNKGDEQTGQNGAADTNDLMEQIDQVLKECTNVEHESISTDKLTSLWLECTKSTGHLVHELCQQLQIVLQPTKMSKYKGDYKSGKRLNMRKIISYIASHYRKDKIWLRRTKPCKRTYNISLAVDNSSSMSENNCRQMTYQSLALLAKALSLIEAGSLNVVSFGGQVKCIHDFDQPYVDAIGAQWLRELRFDERLTSYATLLKHSCESFAKQAQSSAHQQSTNDQRTSVHQLLTIISDGRSVTSESDDIKGYLKQLKSMGVLTLFVIIDDLKQNNGKSIVDVKSCQRIGTSTTLTGYMDSFPFPFYVLLRQLDTMPSILGDALRQWFELVSNGF